MPPSQASEHHKRVTTPVDDDDIDPQVDQQVREWFGQSAVCLRYLKACFRPCNACNVQGCGKVYSQLEVKDTVRLLDRLC